MFYQRTKCYWSENIFYRWNLEAKGTKVTGHVYSGFAPHSTGDKTYIVPIYIMPTVILLLIYKNFPYES